MSERDEHEAGPKAADTRPSGLAAALLRTGASLELETVLNEVVESARALSGARYGAIDTIDETGAPQDFVRLCCKPDVGASQIRTTTVPASGLQQSR